MKFHAVAVTEKLCRRNKKRGKIFLFFSPKHVSNMSEWLKKNITTSDFQLPKTSEVFKLIFQCTSQMKFLHCNISKGKSASGVWGSPYHRLSLPEPSPESIPWRCVTMVQEGLDMENLIKPPLVHSVSYFNLGELGALLGGLSPRGDGTAPLSVTDRHYANHFNNCAWMENVHFKAIKRDRSVNCLATPGSTS